MATATELVLTQSVYWLFILIYWTIDQYDAREIYKDRSLFVSI